MTDLKDKAISIKGKQYVQVKDRILFLADEVKKYSIETDYQYFPERKIWVVKAKLTIIKTERETTHPGEGEKFVYTGLAQEIESDNYKEVNHTSALENAETSAVGRACAMAGIGVLDSIASADEMNKALNRPTYTPNPVVRPATLTPTPQSSHAQTMQQAKTQAQQSPNTLGTCQQCGQPNTIYKASGKVGCSAMCWRNKPILPVIQVEEPTQFVDPFPEDKIPENPFN